MTVVPATSRASSSGGGPTQLFASILGAPAAAIDTGAAAIAATYSIIEVYILARTTQAVALSSALIRVNGDTGANYDWENVAGGNVTPTASNALASTSWALSAVPGASATAGSVAVFCLTFPLYAQTTFRKAGTMLNMQNDQSAAGNNFAIAAALGWRNTAAINQISVTAGSGNLVAGCALYVYGIT